MGDIKCPNCGEPWDAYFLRHDLPYEAGMDVYECEHIEKLLGKHECILTNPTYRERLEEAGWTFSGDRTMLAIKTCGCCKQNGKPPIKENKEVDELEALLAHDEDGFQSVLEDFSNL